MSVGFSPPPPKPRPPRELLFECYSANHVFYRCELMDYGPHGIDAQFIEAPDELRCSHRFLSVDTPGGSLPARAQAIQWAEAVRRDLELGRFTP